MPSRSAGKELQNILQENCGGSDKGTEIVTVKKLEECLDDVTSKIAAAKREMKSIIESHHVQFDKAFELSDIAAVKISDAKHVIQRAFTSLSSSKDSLRSELKGNVEKYKALVKNYQLCKVAIKLLGSLAQFQKNGVSFEQCLSEGGYVQCANAIVQNEHILKEVCSPDAVAAAASNDTAAGVYDSLLSPRVLRILRAAQSKKRVRLQNRVKRCLASAIHISNAYTGNNGTGQVSIVGPVLGAAPHHLHVSNPVPIETFLEAADRLGQFDALVEPLARAMVDGFLAQAIVQARQVEVVVDASGGKTSVRLAIAASGTAVTAVSGTNANEGAGTTTENDEGENNVGVHRVRGVLAQVAKFFDVVHRYVLGGSPEYAGRIGKLIFAPSTSSTASTGGLEQLLLDMLKSALPGSLRQLEAQREGLSSALEQFLSKLSSQGFIAATASGGAAAANLPSLQSFSSELALHFVKAERESMLQRARELISKDAFNSIEVGGTDQGRWGQDAMALPPAGEHILAPIFESGRRVEEDSTMVNTSSLEDTRNNTSSTTLENGLHRGSVAQRPVSFLSFPRCHVTASTVSLVQLSEEAMERACVESFSGSSAGEQDVDTRCRKVYYDTARDVLGLFRAIAPLVKAQEIDQVPRVAMLFHNDCMFIAHNLLTLGSRHASRLPPALRAVVSTVDMVPQFRSLGEQAFRAQLQKQRDFFAKVLNQLPDIARISEEAVFEEAERLVKQLLLTLRNLRAAFTDVLPRWLYAEVMAGLIDLPMQHILERVCALRDIGIEECNQLFHLMQTILDARSSVVPKTPGVSGASTGEGEGASGAADDQQDGFVLVEADAAASDGQSATSATGSLSVTAEKFRLVASLLNDSLATITDNYRNTKVYQKYLRPAEMAGIIRAVFEDNSNRRALLELIAQEQLQQQKQQQQQQ